MARRVKSAAAAAAVVVVVVVEGSVAALFVGSISPVEVEEEEKSVVLVV